MERFRLQRRRRRPSPLRFAPLIALAGFSLAGCSGTRFGDQLAGSFSTPPRAPAQPSGSGSAARPVSPASAARPVAPTRPAVPPAESAATPASTSRPSRAAPVSPPPPAAPPAPYRVTIRLPAADPSAPAERVTQVLRAAGVPFEVEMIERVSGSTGSGGSTALPRTPAPPPR